MTPTPLPGDHPAWLALRDHHVALAGVTTAQLFAADPERGPSLTFEACGLTLDLSRHAITTETLVLLSELAVAADVAGFLDDMMTGAPVNGSENRPALHTALRLPRGASLVVDGVDVAALVHATLDRMATLATAVAGGTWTGSTGRPIRTVVHIGIGGSDLGPVLTYQALAPYRTGPEVRFVANLDGADLVGALTDLDPAETLFIVASKSFTTPETLGNAHAARSWLSAGLGDDLDLSRHLVAVTAATERAADLGVDEAHVLPLWDWVGGRFSLLSAIGLSTMIAVGPTRFAEILAGAAAMDDHVRSTPIERNLPILMALVAIWHRNLDDCGVFAVVPYDHRLRRLPAYLQQLVMESNGKGVGNDGNPVARSTAPVVLGEPGTNAQHSFLQLLHQGPANIPTDLIIVARPGPDVSADPTLAGQHRRLVANAVAQAEAFVSGRVVDPAGFGGGAGVLPSYRSMPGNRPTSVLVVPDLTPFALGSLIALYEHAVIVQAAVWGINPFDQWGVELGKELAVSVLPLLDATSSTTDDEAMAPSFAHLVRTVRPHLDPPAPPNRPPAPPD